MLPRRSLISGSRLSLLPNVILKKCGEKFKGAPTAGEHADVEPLMLEFL
jgi:hypothetical protein